MKINLIQNDNGTPALEIRKSTTGQIDIPYPMDTYSPLLKELNALIPQEWQDTISNLRKQERELINKRRALVHQYRLELEKLIKPTISSFPDNHPEYFI